jgi:hypothetical protein
MPIFFWLPMIIFGGLWEIAVASAPRTVSRAPTPVEDNRHRQRRRPWSAADPDR